MQNYSASVKYEGYKHQPTGESHFNSSSATTNHYFYAFDKKKKKAIKNFALSQNEHLFFVIVFA